MAVSTKLSILTLWTSDTAPTIQWTVTQSDGAGAQDLAGASAKCHIRLMGGTTNVFSGTDEDATVVGDGSAGRINYTLPSALTDPGVYYAQLEITYSGGLVQRTQRVQLNVEEGM